MCVAQVVFAARLARRFRSLSSVSLATPCSLLASAYWRIGIVPIAIRVPAAATCELAMAWKRTSREPRVTISPIEPSSFHSVLSAPLVKHIALIKF